MYGKRYSILYTQSNLNVFAQREKPIDELNMILYTRRQKLYLSYVTSDDPSHGVFAILQTTISLRHLSDPSAHDTQIAGNKETCDPMIWLIIVQLNFYIEIYFSHTSDQKSMNCLRFSKKPGNSVIVLFHLILLCYYDYYAVTHSI